MGSEMCIRDRVYAPRHSWLEPSPLLAGLYDVCSVWLACRRRPCQASTDWSFPQTPLYRRFSRRRATPASFHGFCALRRFSPQHHSDDRPRQPFPWQDDDRLSPGPVLLRPWQQALRFRHRVFLRPIGALMVFSAISKSILRSSRSTRMTRTSTVSPRRKQNRPRRKPVVVLPRKRLSRPIVRVMLRRKTPKCAKAVK